MTTTAWPNPWVYVAFAENSYDASEPPKTGLEEGVQATRTGAAIRREYPVGDLRLDRCP